MKFIKLVNDESEKTLYTDLRVPINQVSIRLDQINHSSDWKDGKEAIMKIYGCVDKMMMTAHIIVY